MPDSSPAVFLSYASQDAEAAHYLAASLRANDIEVWFDQHELRGGDSWDHKIKQQIKTCALFLPVISTHTQERAEGYFRLEWKLAVDRSHLMADDAPFLFPVVIDGTTDQQARVPERFRERQWMRLLRGEPTPDFIAQIKHLLSPASAAPEGAALETSAARIPTASGGHLPLTNPPVSVAPRRPVTPIAIVLAISLGIGLWIVIGLGKTSPPPVSAPLPSGGVSRPAEPVTAVIPAKSIAVLPFENRSASADDAYFTDGVHDDLLTALSRLADLKTISRTSVMTYRGSEKQLKQIGEELGVATILQGGVQRAGNQVRINVQLTDAATDANLWAESFTRALTAENIFAIQTEIASAITTALRAVLSPEEQQQLETLPTENLAALEAYFRGKQELEKYTSIALVAAIPYFERSIELDPDFAQAYAGLARTLLHQVWFSSFPVEQQTALAEPLISRAMELNDQLPEAWTELGSLHSQRGEPEAAESAFKRAIELGPNTANAFKAYGSFLQWSDNDPANAVEVLRQATLVDPQDPGAKIMLASALASNFQRDEALAILLDPKLSAEKFTRFDTLANLHQSSFHRYDLAIQALRSALAIDPKGKSELLRRMGECYQALGDHKQAHCWRQRYFSQQNQNDEPKFWEAWEHLLNEDAAAAHAAIATINSKSHFYPSTRYLVFRLAEDPATRQTAFEQYEKVIPGLLDSTQSIGNRVNFLIHAEMLWRLGKMEKAQSQAQRVIASLPEQPQARWQLIDQVVAAYALAGETPQALQALRTYVVEDGAIDYRSRRISPWQSMTHEILRTEPEFLELVSIMNERLDEQRANVKRMESNGELAPIPELMEDAL